MSRRDDETRNALAALKRQYPHPVPGKEADVSEALWMQWEHWKDTEDQARLAREACEASLRAEIADAPVITVAGLPVARRIIRRIDNASWTDDHLRRIPPKGPASE